MIAIRTGRSPSALINTDSPPSGNEAMPEQRYTVHYQCLAHKMLAAWQAAGASFRIAHHRVNRRIRHNNNHTTTYVPSSEQYSLVPATRSTNNQRETLRNPPPNTSGARKLSVGCSEAVYTYIVFTARSETSH